VRLLGSEKKISSAVIKRLPRYYRYLSDLMQMGISRVSSRDLSLRMGITSSQVRQDFNCFGGFGLQGYGYDVELLKDELCKILGLSTLFNLIIIGAGSLGQSLAKHSNFEKRGFKVIGIFDINPNIIDHKIKDIEIMHLDKLSEFTKNNQVDIAVITVPNVHAHEVVGLVTSLGIKGVWNFAPIELTVPADVVIENIHLSDSLMVLGYNIIENRMKEK
jgi:redox-sensing transcriptional repressor